MTSDRVCQSCKLGQTFKPSSGNNDCTVCQTCRPGTYVGTQPTLTTDRKCIDCASDSFSTTTNADLCFCKCYDFLSLYIKLWDV